MSKAKSKVQEPEVIPEPVKIEDVVGRSKFLFPDGSSYDGDWKQVNNVKQKSGEGIYINGKESYVGSWAGDTMHGHGVYKFASGACYTGSFVQNNFDGPGEYIFHDGAKYRYVFLCSCVHFKVLYHSGQWKCGKMHGDGEYIDECNVSWKGNFFNGMYDTGRSYLSIRPAKSIL